MTPTHGELRQVLDIVRRSINPATVAALYDRAPALGSAPWAVATAASDMQDAMYRLAGALDDCTEDDDAASAPKPWDDPTTDLVEELEDLLYNHTRWQLHADDISERLESIRVLVSHLTGVEVKAR
ncbi:hypothetical protein [Corynebacterium glyciniphilum]|uniref:hypothetical protein n=1 Tax=Corynebacterium glyciniphilum TaxID=1404244 RepID=UPI0011AB4819|nr:hypothetical protein [Corynebacterium glyciniphilum]